MPTLPLDNIRVTRALVDAFLTLLESERDRINAALADHLGEGAVPLTLGRIFSGRRPNRTVYTFPCISVTATSRSQQWVSYRETQDTIGLRVMCYVKVLDDDTQEAIMQDLSDVVISILRQHPAFEFAGQCGEPAETVAFRVFNAEVSSVVFGNVDQGDLRAAQIDWSGQFLQYWEHMDLPLWLDVPEAASPA